MPRGGTARGAAVSSTRSGLSILGVQEAADKLARSLTASPTVARPHYERVLRIARLALDRHMAVHAMLVTSCSRIGFDSSQAVARQDRFRSAMTAVGAFSPDA
jgi:hypothetical protein